MMQEPDDVNRTKAKHVTDKLKNSGLLFKINYLLLSCEYVYKIVEVGYEINEEEKIGNQKAKYLFSHE